ncbi:HEAT repeat domain-containing protein [[Phormidium] sp. ETS-05]|uniref:HEAT repeat domain-containing protein n=1 Tax=[Phormidium] sp. ETS-05 TaxID=222819 RepID=UPI0018EF2091|nr:HEAT repeat domain-containing protein [[Phormidium] sp. ETS-05]
MTKLNYPQLWQVLPAAVLSFFLSLVTPSQAQESPEIKQQIDGAIEQLQDGNPDNDAAALQQLGEIGRDAKDTALEIIKFLDAKKYSPSVRSEAAVALARIQPQADLVVDELLKGLSDRDETVRAFVAIALGRLGEPVLDDIIQVITESKKIETRDAAWLALEKMAEKTAQKMALYQNSLDEKNYQYNLNIISKIAQVWEKHHQEVSPESIKLAGNFLDKLFDSNNPHNLGEAQNKLIGISSDIEKQRSIINASRATLKNLSLPPPPWQPPAWLSNSLICLGLYSLFPLTWGVILWVNPLGLLWIMKILQIRELTVTIPGTGGAQVNLSLHNLLMLDYFHYHPRVLDAWVNKYIEAARTGFEQEETVKNNLVIPRDVKIEIGGQIIDKLTREQLDSTFAKTYSRLLIWGESGVGKTSLACTIARWGMAADQNQRLCPHLMIPLLVEGKRLDGQDSLLEVIMGELQGDILNLDIDENISPDFLLYLLRRKRILVIVDNFSEMSEGEKEKINPQAHDFPINALIVTSQKEEDLGNVVKTKVKLSRLNSNARGENLN